VIEKGHCCNCDSELEAEDLSLLEFCDNCGSNDIEVDDD
jgi:Zn finger protein HypA/HybF involved in hydrogenase expression